MSGPPLVRLRRRAARYAAQLEGEQAAAWIAFHGLLSMGDEAALPAAMHASVERLRRRWLAENTARLWRFQDVVDALDGIPVCPLKGIDLLERIYPGDPEVRPLWDIDLLLRPGDLGAAVERLENRLGFTEAAASRRARGLSHHRWLDADGVQLELHTGLGMELWGRIGWEALRPRAGRAHERSVYLLDEPTLLVHLLVHFAQHGALTRLKWVEDILRLEALGVDQPAALARARQLGVGPAAAASVRILRRFLGGDVLPRLDARGGLAAPAIALNERLFWRRARRGRLGPITQPRGWRRNLSVLLLSGSPSRALSFAGRKLGEVWRRAPGE